jgi:hypothetical protein
MVALFLDLQLRVQSVSITTKVVSSNLAQDEEIANGETNCYGLLAKWCLAPIFQQ